MKSIFSNFFVGIDHSVTLLLLQQFFPSLLTNTQKERKVKYWSSLYDTGCSIWKFHVPNGSKCSFLKFNFQISQMKTTLLNKLKTQMEHPVWTTVWNFIVIISPFYHINKKVRLHFFAIKIQSFHAALNSDAEEEVGPNLESMAWKFSHFLRFFPKIIKVLWNAPYSTTFI